jgi:hypothetical protein
MVVDVQVVVFDQLKPSSLPQIQLRLCEDVLQALVVGENVTFVSHQVMPSYLQSVDDSSQFEVMGGVVLLVLPKLS